jgi:hypothetical protein
MKNEYQISSSQIMRRLDRHDLKSNRIIKGESSEWLVAVEEFVAGDANIRYVVRIDQDTGEYQEFRQWDIFPFDAIDGQLYGYDTSIGNEVRMDCEDPLRQLYL